MSGTRERRHSPSKPRLIPIQTQATVGPSDARDPSFSPSFSPPFHHPLEQLTYGGEDEKPLRSLFLELVERRTAVSAHKEPGQATLSWALHSTHRRPVPLKTQGRPCILGPGRLRLPAKLRKVCCLSITRPLFTVSCFGSTETQKHLTKI